MKKLGTSLCIPLFLNFLASIHSIDSKTHSVWPDPPGWSAAAGWEGGCSRWRLSRGTEDRISGSQPAKKTQRRCPASCPYSLTFNTTRRTHSWTWGLIRKACLVKTESVHTEMRETLKFLAILHYFTASFRGNRRHEVGEIWRDVVMRSVIRNKTLNNRGYYYILRIFAVDFFAYKRSISFRCRVRGWRFVHQKLYLRSRALTSYQILCVLLRFFAK